VKLENDPTTPDTVEPGTSTLIIMMLSGLIRIGVAALPQRLRHNCISVCGMVVLFTPLLLWIAWSKAVFYMVLASGGCAVIIIWLLVRFAPDEHF
jgi:hypothetical protein